MKIVCCCFAIFFVCLLAASGIVSCHKQTAPASQAPVTVTLIHSLPSLLHESSGLCYTDGSLWSFGDSGNPPSLFKIDTSTGAILQTVTIQNFTNEDWEDITADDNYIYIGDFGNNSGTRKDLRILRIRKSKINPALSEVSLAADAIYFSYSDQQDFTSNNATNFNCEALAAIEDNLYLFTKDAGDRQTRCYQLTKIPGVYSIDPVSSFNTEGEITSAAYNSNTNELALGGYESGKQHPFIWFFKDFAGNHFFEGNKIKISLSGDNTAWQTEGIDYISPNRMFLSCESTSAIPASLYTVVNHFVY